jgi:hypothetical protein
LQRTRFPPVDVLAGSNPNVRSNYRQFDYRLVCLGVFHGSGLDARLLRNGPLARLFAMAVAKKYPLVGQRSNCYATLLGRHSTTPGGRSGGGFPSPRSQKSTAALVIRVTRTPPLAIASKVFEKVAHLYLGPIFGREPRQSILPAAAAHRAGHAQEIILSRKPICVTLLTQRIWDAARISEVGRQKLSLLSKDICHEWDDDLNPLLVENDLLGAFIRYLSRIGMNQSLRCSQ